jgi:hypothetical protein
VKIVHGTQWEEDYDGGVLLHVSRQSLKMQELKGMAALLEREAGHCSEVFGELCGLFLRVDPHGPEVSEVEVLSSLSDLLMRLDKEEGVGSPNDPVILNFATRSVGRAPATVRC